ncbi:MYG1 family protein [Candidatus Nomurabacteria bacterium]|nr:MYG1 family protein [Candidatus Nomurabacteria bacterium]
MNIFKKKKLLVTHNGTFHADDIFATAALSILCDGNIKVVRTRDTAIMLKADFLYDVGGEYNPITNRYDHHQPGGAGVRANGVPYSSFGLIWKQYGERLCGSMEVADLVDQKIVQPIDANDNGIDTFSLKNAGGLYVIQNFLYAFRPTWKEPAEYDIAFFKCVDFAKILLKREIVRARAQVEAKNIIESFYEKALDKRIIELDAQYPWKDFILQHEEPLYIISPKDGMWRIECVLKERYSFENRKSLPESWAGLRDEALEKVTGVKGASFCHNGRFLIVAKTRVAIIELAKKALLA